MTKELLCKLKREIYNKEVIFEGNSLSNTGSKLRTNPSKCNGILSCPEQSRVYMCKILAYSGHVGT